MQEKSGYRLGFDAANGKSLGVINDVVAKLQLPEGIRSARRGNLLRYFSMLVIVYERRQRRLVQLMDHVAELLLGP